jgi:hypothetical protein
MYSYLDSARASVRQRVSIAVIAAGCCGVLASPAGAVTPAPAWSVRTIAQPTNFAPGSGSLAEDRYLVLVTNTGSLPSDGSPIHISDLLPSGVNPSLGYRPVGFDWALQSRANTGEGGLLHCSLVPLECTWEGVVPAGEVLEMEIPVEPPATEGPLVNVASVTGGGAPAASDRSENAVSGALAPFAIKDFSFEVDGSDGAPDVAAGDHPYSVTTTVDFPTNIVSESGASTFHPAEAVKDTIVELPLGFVGDPQAAPRCPLSDLETNAAVSNVLCPADTKIGDVTLSTPEGEGNSLASSLLPEQAGSLEQLSGVTPLYNMVPEAGHPAEFAFDFAGQALALLYPSVVATPHGYVLRVTTPNTLSVFLPQGAFVGGFSLTLFGDPAVHDGAGGEAPFFTNPSSCSASPSERTARVYIDTWEHPATATNADGTPDLEDPDWRKAESTLPQLTGCNALHFEPSLSFAPGVTRGGSPSGATVDVRVPQAPEHDAALATPDVKDVSVTLPAGLSLSPSAANGLQACSPAEIGLEDNAQPTCPEASRIGTVELTTPLLAKTVGGSVYLAEQDNNPFGSLLAVYVVVDDPATGTLIKLAGKGELGDGSNGLAAGQIRTTFENNPQLPFSELRLKLEEGPGAPLSTPVSCGSYATEASLLPWSAPESGGPAVSSSSFTITSGPNGEACGSLGFHPSLSAGTVNNQAGGFGAFTLTLARTDADQQLGSLSVTTPPGLLGMLSKVALCGEPQAAQGACPAASQIGHVTVAAGPGPDPVFVPQAGKPEDPVYLTGPYKGAPFGLSVVVPAEAGPFNLGTVVVRSAISVNPHTSQITITSDPFPTILDGIPLQIKTVNVTIDRAGFIFNPTSCAPLSIAATVTSTQGTQAPVSSSFQAANCATLPFKPGLTATVTGKASKADGAGLDVRVTSGAGQANIAMVKVDLPKQLPSRLTTLQKACLARVFEADPAACPPEADVGTATAVTPVLSHPLIGPAYLVSRGGEGFPDLEIVLQGEGITLILDGNTDVKNGITSSTFKTVPDAPITSFELKLPTGKYSVLGANVPPSAYYSLCGQTLAMPTALTGQNGIAIHDTTKITASGCTKKAKNTKNRKKTSKHKKK